MIMAVRIEVLRAGYVFILLALTVATYKKLSHPNLLASELAVNLSGLTFGRMPKIPSVDQANLAKTTLASLVRSRPRASLWHFARHFLPRGRPETGSEIAHGLSKQSSLQSLAKFLPSGVTTAGSATRKRKEYRSVVTVKGTPHDDILQTRLLELRLHLKAERLTAYIVPHTDAHNSEYIADRDARLQAISGFTGSYGTAVVTQKNAFLWTDARYAQQAQQEMPNDWLLMTEKIPGTPRIEDWLASELDAHDRVGIDAGLTTVLRFQTLKCTLEPRSIVLVPMERNLIDAVWSLAAPDLPSGIISLHLDELHGHPISKQLQRVREAIQEEGVSALLVSALDQIAWLLNLRGSDISFNPVFFAYLAITAQTCTLYADIINRLSAEAYEYLMTAGVSIKPYDSIFQGLQDMSAATWVDPKATSLSVLKALGAAAYVKETPIEFWQSCKTDQEVEGMRQAHVRDGVAKTRWLFWLEDAMAKLATRPLDETSVASKLHDFRKAQEHFVGSSFATVSAFGPNGALMHYTPDPNSCAIANISQLYLCDSGAHYSDGTTDVTRTMHFAEPSRHQQRCFTRVMKGVIALSTAVFPQDTPPSDLDSLARQPLLAAGLDYRHATSHGVGAYLNVHETLAGVLRPGMILSNEPGYYEDGAFGIRIENLMVCKETGGSHKFFGRPYCTFETLTVVPIQAKMLDLEMLTEREIQWIDSYHAMVFAKLEPHMQTQLERARLRMATAPLLSFDH